MKLLILSDEQYETLCSELSSVYGYHWNDKTIHAKDCGSNILDSMDEYDISNESLNKIFTLIQKD